MGFVILSLYIVFTHKGILSSTHPNHTDFIGASHWKEDWLNLCNKKHLKNPTEKAFVCHAFIRSYQFINVEVLSEDPMLVIFRDFAPDHYVENFLEDVGELKMMEQKVVKNGQENVSESSPSRQANGTWIDHTASDGVARMFRRAMLFLPFINFSNSDLWQ
ncbi:hypothetical protein GCK32_011687, partial [Trichostrongylus colubriformis]